MRIDYVYVQVWFPAQFRTDEAHLHHPIYHSHSQSIFFLRHKLFKIKSLIILTAVINCVAPCCRSSIPLSLSEPSTANFSATGGTSDCSNISASKDARKGDPCSTVGCVQGKQPLQTNKEKPPRLFTYVGWPLGEPIETVQPFGTNPHKRAGRFG